MKRRQDLMKLNPENEMWQHNMVKTTLGGNLVCQYSVRSPREGAYITTVVEAIGVDMTHMKYRDIMFDNWKDAVIAANGGDRTLKVIEINSIDHSRTQKCIENARRYAGGVLPNETTRYKTFEVTDANNEAWQALNGKEQNPFIQGIVKLLEEYGTELNGEERDRSPRIDRVVCGIYLPETPKPDLKAKREAPLRPDGRSMRGSTTPTSPASSASDQALRSLAERNIATTWLCSSSGSITKCKGGMVGNG
ncbi:Uu.00g023420.m01.CDS01 [Anthostomella pinea]|uniref:Uu.00g023420.m01.CDS01 n=1 Tax=Anthostomella pinea TaxID=933095 RepID=A0AAI8YR02_9PEZI|nr:Uu.00g023420.m01.CDS01 [Anthostomella pinea]